MPEGRDIQDEGYHCDIKHHPAIEISPVAEKEHLPTSATPTAADASTMLGPVSFSAALFAYCCRCGAIMYMGEATSDTGTCSKCGHHSCGNCTRVW